MPVHEFVEVLQAHLVDKLVDIRTVPRSKHNPQFNRNDLALSLSAAGIGYLHMKEMGGLRHPARNSRNLGWRNASFRGFADYMQTEEFQVALEDLARLASQKKIAIMCAEGNPFRCHRSLVADALTVRGAEVIHITGVKGGRAHRVTPFARVTGTTLYYPGERTAPP